MAPDHARPKRPPIPTNEEQFEPSASRLVGAWRTGDAAAESAALRPRPWLNGVQRPIQKPDLAAFFEAALARAATEKSGDADFCAALLNAVYALYNDDYETNGLFFVGCWAEGGRVCVDYRSQPGGNRDVVLCFDAGAWRVDEAVAGEPVQDVADYLAGWLQTDYPDPYMYPSREQE